MALAGVILLSKKSRFARRSHDTQRLAVAAAASVIAVDFGYSDVPIATFNPDRE
jgi:hypothetical protein